MRKFKLVDKQPGDVYTGRKYRLVDRVKKVKPKVKQPKPSRGGYSTYA